MCDYECEIAAGDDGRPVFSVKSRCRLLPTARARAGPTEQSESDRSRRVRPGRRVRTVFSPPDGAAQGRRGANFGAGGGGGGLASEEPERPIVAASPDECWNQVARNRLVTGASPVK